MQKFVVSIITFCCVLFSVQAQEVGIDGTWNFSSIQNSQNESIIPITTNDQLTLEKGEFQYQLAAKENLKASGDYIYQNNLLVFYYNTPKDTIRKYKISSLTDSTFVFNEKGVSYHFKKEKKKEEVVTTTENISEIIPSEGFSTSSLIRGILGMLVLLVIAFLCSSNRRAINWKTVNRKSFYRNTKLHTSRK